MLLRRVLSLCVAALLIPLLVLLVALGFACGTVLQPDYPADRFEEAGPYDFLLDRLLPTMLDDARNSKSLSTDGTLENNPLVVLGVSNRHLVAWTTRVVPRKWFDETARASATDVWKYVTGVSDEFTINLRLPIEDEVLTAETSTLLRRSHLYDYAVDSHLAPAAQEILAAEVLPFGSDLSAARVESAVRQVVSKGWFDARVSEAVAAFVPYATGSENGFEVSMDLAELGPAATAEYKLLLYDTGAYDSLYDSIVEPAVLTLHGERIDLAPGVSLHTEDVVTAIRDAGRGQWAKDEVDKAVDQVAGYLFGNTDSFSFVVSLDPISNEVASRLEEVVHGRILALATVTGGTAADAQARRTVAGRADIILADVAPQIVAPLSGEVTFTDFDLRDALSSEDREQLDDIRAIMRDGFLYTEEDLRGDIERNFDDPESVEQAIETVRELFSDGWTYTHIDLESDLSADTAGPSDIEFLRSALGLLRLSPWIVSALVLTGLAVLWLVVPAERRVKTVWVAAALTAGFLTSLLFFAVAYFASDAAIDAARKAAVDAVDRRGDFAASGVVAIPWVYSILQSSMAGYTSGVAVTSALLAALSLGGLAASLRWPQLESLARRYVWPRRE